MIDVDCMIRSLRLGWLQRVFNDSSATWKRYFLYLLEHVGGIFFLSCNFDVKDFFIYPVHSTTNFCNGGQNLAIFLLKKRIIKALFGTMKK